ncbi:CAP domain-containing protein [Aquimarina sediminis]|uniref:CAP domain-containing protein n=1 Tax=Aquimarina sediminis TaxID=2070536 RepID=UPI000CA00318|nr:CAP domain-containing protein [Aquimarina sediminis]
MKRQQKLKGLLLAILSITLLITSCTKDESQVELEEQTLEVMPNAKLSNEEIQVIHEIYYQVNDHRQSIGLQPLIWSNAAYTESWNHTQYMIQEGSISHDGFSQRYQNLVYSANARSMSENVASHYRSASSVVEGWLNSSGHRDNIEGDYTHTGIAAIKDSEGNFYYTQIFYR